MKKRIIVGTIIAVVVVLIAGLALWQSGYFNDPAPTYRIEMAAGEIISNWDFKGAYTGDVELEAKARADITRLEGLLGSGEYTDYTLYISLANQYDLLGDGKNELASLEKALAIDSTVTGLAWHNAGQLFARLGANASAKMALERAYAVQPIVQYKRALEDFLAKHPDIAG